MAGGKKRRQKKQNKNNKEKSTREEDVPRNISPVEEEHVEDHVEEFSDGNDSEGVSATSQVKHFFGFSRKNCYCWCIIIRWVYYWCC